MRVIYISNSDFSSRAANCVHVIKMVQAFGRLGHETTLIALSNRVLSKESLIKQYGGFDGFTLTVPGGQGRVAVFLSLLSLSHTIRKADLVIGRFLPGCLLAALLGVPAVLEYHEPILDRRRHMLRILLRLKSFRGLIVVTEALKREFIKRHPNLEGRAFVFPDGADILDKPPPHISLATSPSSKLQAGYLGHLYSGKGLEVIERVAPLCSSVDFHIIGGSEEDISHWRTRCASIPNIRFYGYVPHAQTPSYIQAFDVALLPNGRTVQGYRGGRSIAEWTSPLKLFEYMALGKAIVGSRLSVLEEVLVDGRNALLCDPDKPDEWLKALELLRDASLRRRLGEQARQDIEQRYSWVRRAEAIICAATAVA